jgi:hypothetical protein
MASAAAGEKGDIINNRGVPLSYNSILERQNDKKDNMIINIYFKKLQFNFNFKLNYQTY